MVKKGKAQLFLALFLCCMVSSSNLVSGATVAEQCSNQFTKVTACLTFATGKSNTPTKECCSSVTDIKENNPVCLCFIIQQIHNGTNASLKSMGIQEAKLLQLPSACKMANASVADCPKLLHLPANSPDAAIFTNAPTSATTTPVTTPGTSSPTTAGSSNGFKHVPQLAGPIVLAAAIFFCAFPSGVASRFLA